MDISSLLGFVGSSVWTLAFFILALVIIVFVHEYGHYIVGRWSGIHAEVFSIGFGPVLYTRTDRRGTRWQVAAVPLGGYVKFLGDADAASGKDGAAISGLSAEERRHTMHGAPLWARAATVAAGPIFNFILTIVVYIGMVTYFGVATDKPTVRIVAEMPATQDGLLPGDQILAVNGVATPDWETLITVGAEMPPAHELRYEILRAGEKTEVLAPHLMPPLVGSVQLKSAAFAAGMQEGDVILAANGQDVTAFSQLPPIVEGLAGAPVPLKIWRKGQIIEMAITPNRRDIPKDDGFETRWLIGLGGGILFEPEVRHAGPLETVQLALERTWFAAKTSLSGLWHMITGAISSCNLSGPVGMAQVLGQAATMGPDFYISMLAVMSLGIGMLNLFPIPVLDGGHLVFFAYEAVFRKPPSDRALRILMTGGLAFILSFMVFALTNDFFCK